MFLHEPEMNGSNGSGLLHVRLGTVARAHRTVKRASDGAVANHVGNLSAAALATTSRCIARVYPIEPQHAATLFALV